MSCPQPPCFFLLHLYLLQGNRWRSRKKWKLGVRHLSQQDSSVKENCSQHWEYFRKKQIQDLLPLSAILDESDPNPNLSSQDWKKEQYLVMYLGLGMLWAGLVASVISPYAGTLYTRETYYPPLFIFLGPLRGVADQLGSSQPGSCSSHVALQAPLSPDMRIL